MGYIMPIPQYQYNDYRERVLNETSMGYSSVDPAEKVTFDKVLRDRSEPQMSLEEQRKNAKVNMRHSAYIWHKLAVKDLKSTNWHNERRMAYRDNPIEKAYSSFWRIRFFAVRAVSSSFYAKCRHLKIHQIQSRSRVFHKKEWPAAGHQALVLSSRRRFSHALQSYP